MSKTYKLLKGNQYSVGGNTPSFCENGGKVWVNENILKHHMRTLDPRAYGIYDDCFVVIYENGKETTKVSALDWLDGKVTKDTPKPKPKQKASPKKPTVKKEEPENVIDEDKPKGEE